MHEMHRAYFVFGEGCALDPVSFAWMVQVSHVKRRDIDKYLSVSTVSAIAFAATNSPHACMHQPMLKWESSMQPPFTILADHPDFADTFMLSHALGKQIPSANSFQFRDN